MHEFYLLKTIYPWLITTKTTTSKAEIQMMLRVFDQGKTTGHEEGQNIGLLYSFTPVL